MAWIDGNSFAYDSRGWTLLTGTNRNNGSGQSGLGSLRATLGANTGAQYGFASRTELITGFCWKHSVSPSSRIAVWGISGFDALALVGGTGGELIVYRNGFSTEIGRSGTGVIAAAVENYIEMRVKGSTTVGEVELRVNGDPNPVLLLTGVNAGSADYDRLDLISSPAGTRDHSAWYLLDTTAGAGWDEDFLGHVRYAALDPTGNGNSSGLLGSDGNSTDNYLLVDDGFDHDSDTTYVQGSVVGDKDTYAMEDLPTPPLTIYAVLPVVTAKKTDAGTRSIVPVIRRSGTDYDAATEHFLGTSYQSFRQAIDLDPSTGLAWTEAGVNAMELGVKVAS
jgi:hypothetical protein